MANRALAGVLAAALLAAGCHKEAPPSPGVWAVVNGTEIPRTEVEKYYRTRVNPQGPVPSQEESLSLMLNILERADQQSNSFAARAKTGPAGERRRSRGQVHRIQESLYRRRVPAPTAGSAPHRGRFEERHPRRTLHPEADQSRGSGENHDHRSGCR